MANQSPTRESGKNLAKDMQVEDERMHDVLLLIESLLQREEVTVKLILSCLYDVGSTNLINQKLRSRSLNQLMRWVAKLSKPMFRIVALRWLKKNCPRLITKWLYSQVKFDKPKAAKREALTVAALTVQPDAVAQLQEPNQDALNREILRLHSQVRALSVLLLAVTVTLGGGFAWSVWRDESEMQSATQVKAVFANIVANSNPCLSDRCNKVDDVTIRRIKQPPQLKNF